MEPQGEFEHQYRIEHDRVLGHGIFGTVYKGRDVSTGLPVAIKLFNIEDQPLYYPNELLSTSRHPNVVGMHHLSAAQNANQMRAVYDLCEEGNLASLIKRAAESRPERPIELQSPCLSPVVVLRLMKQLACGMAHLHSHHLMHRNLRTSNLLLHNGTLKISGFLRMRTTVSQDIYKAQRYDITGDPLYNAPEIVNFSPYNAKCDVWSAGLAVYEMLAGRSYFEAARSMGELISLQAAPKIIPASFGIYFQKTLQSMLSFNQSNRPTFEQLLKSVDEQLNSL